MEEIANKVIALLDNAFGLRVMAMRNKKRNLITDCWNTPDPRVKIAVTFVGKNGRSGLYIDLCIARPNGVFYRLGDLINAAAQERYMKLEGWQRYLITQFPIPSIVHHAANSKDPIPFIQKIIDNFKK